MPRCAPVHVRVCRRHEDVLSLPSPPPQVADDIRYLINEYDKTIPTVLEIPSKDVPYDTSRDPILRRINQMFGE